jgi:hypothetical protein
MAASRNSALHPVPGLCGDCAYARRIESDRGSLFLLCQRSLTDSGFAKYPRLPVLSCRGFAAKPAEDPVPFHPDAPGRSTED